MELAKYLDSKGRGGRIDLAKRIGAHPPDVSDWVNGRRPVPVARCAAIERATGGAVTRRDLRPDDWHLIWPDLAAASEVSPQNQPAVLDLQARAAIKTVAQEVANVGA